MLWDNAVLLIYFKCSWSKQSHDTLIKAAGPVSIIGNSDAFRGRPTTRAFPFPRSQRFRNAAVPESLILLSILGWHFSVQSQILELYYYLTVLSLL